MHPSGAGGMQRTIFLRTTRTRLKCRESAASRKQTPIPWGCAQEPAKRCVAPSSLLSEKCFHSAERLEPSGSRVLETARPCLHDRRRNQSSARPCLRCEFWIRCELSEAAKYRLFLNSPTRSGLWKSRRKDFSPVRHRS